MDYYRRPDLRATLQAFPLLSIRAKRKCKVLLPFFGAKSCVHPRAPIHLTGESRPHSVGQITHDWSCQVEMQDFALIFRHPDFFQAECRITNQSGIKCHMLQSRSKWRLGKSQIVALRKYGHVQNSQPRHQRAIIGGNSATSDSTSNKRLIDRRQRRPAHTTNTWATAPRHASPTPDTRSESTQ
jgi:hypothetical protein